MKRLLCSLLSGAFCFVATAQNLIPNPSFENNVGGWFPPNPGIFWSELPKAGMATTHILDWFTPTNGTSDYHSAAFNRCPSNHIGLQDARTGNSVGGLITYGLLIDGYAEYISVKLTQPLVHGRKYAMSYWVSLADRVTFGHDRLGVLFLDTMFSHYSNNPAIFSLNHLSPQLETPPGMTFTDKENWTNITHVYEAAGGENWIILGCFKGPNSLTLVPTPPQNPAFGVGAYYYYDDLCLIDLDDGMPLASSTTDTCYRGEMVLNGRQGTGITYLWNDGDTVFNKTITESGNYWVKSVDINQCAYYIDSFNISPGQLTDLTLGPDLNLCEGETYILAATNNLPQGLSYLWNTGDTTCCITVKAPGEYVLSVSSICGASDSEKVSVTYRNCEVKCPLSIPNAFSPNNDGLNDIFKPVLNCEANGYLLEIYNRWGASVFSSSNAEKGWDGTYNDKEADAGVYFYNLRVQYPNGGIFTKKSDITLIR